MGTHGSGVDRARVSNWNAANIITVARILFAPAFIWLLLVSTDQASDVTRWVAAGLFVLGMATDGIDGFVARRYNLVTDLGKILDPIADKVLTGGALIALSILGELPWWVTALILVREVGITIFRMAVISDQVIPASRGGKIKTVVQFVAITAALMPLSALWGAPMDIVNTVLMTLVVIITLATGVDYLVDGVRQQRRLAAGSASAKKVSTPGGKRRGGK
ncbi:MAG: CDP-diacylglycerol--glycerol-3-phosphate 3-phosphatidyltransferase [Aurantimicrobium sp.]|nr:CDP-diacylglycerol--glycerol-3-phosphate 3-phosphatidyltransferase [Aurantimicrobium sp.]